MPGEFNELDQQTALWLARIFNALNRTIETIIRFGNGLDGEFDKTRKIAYEIRDELYRESRAAEIGREDLMAEISKSCAEQIAEEKRTRNILIAEIIVVELMQFLVFIIIFYKK